MTSLSEPDYYDVLGVGRDAAASEIKSELREGARRCHQDLTCAPDAQDRFAELSRAYAILSKPTSRILYDRVGYRGRGNGSFDSTPPTTESLGRLVDVAEVEVGVLEALRGATRRVSVTTVGTCAACTGTGAAAGSQIDECAACAGEGRLRRTGSLGTARLLQIDECEDCRGSGRLVREAGGECVGTGRTQGARKLELRLPPGPEDGKLIRAQDPQEGREVYLALRVVPREENGLLRYAAGAALFFALALFAVLALAPEALTG